MKAISSTPRVVAALDEGDIERARIVATNDEGDIE
jgi:hypothetical protein